MPSNRKEPKNGWRTPIICGVLLLLTLAVYWPTMGHDFVGYDDPDYETANPHVLSGINKESVVWAFTTGFAGNWHPVTWVSHELDCQIYGKKPLGPHLTNLLFHVANTLLLFGVLRMMTGAMWRSAFVAALFAWHPTHVESVAWVSERKDVLSAFFWLLTMVGYVRYVQQPETERSKAKIYYGLSLICCVLGLMSKPMLVTLPFGLLLLDYWPLKRICDLRFAIYESKGKEVGNFRPVTLSRAILEKTPFLLLATASSVVTFVAQRKGDAVVELSALSVGARFANALVSYLRYVGKLFWPENLCVLYPLQASWPMLLVATAAAFVVVMSVLAIWQARRRPYLFVGWFWFAGTLVPVIGLVQVGLQAMADRYLYVPAIGLFIAATWGVTELAGAWRGKRELLGAGAAIVLAACCVATRAQIQYWENTETLFRRAIRVTEGNYLAYNNLGYYLLNHEKPEEAVLDLQEALKIKPNLVEARNLLGNALADVGKEDEAIKQYELSLQYNPNDEDAHNNLGIARAMQGRLDEAEKLLREAVRLKPADVGAHLNLGNVLALKHRLEEATREYKAVIKLNPDDAQTHYNLGNVFMERGQMAEAADEYVTAIKLRPNDPDAHYKLGELLAGRGKRDEALAHFREALRLNPKLTEAQRQIDALSSGK